jgi:filamentous hemagglutinin
MWHRCPYKLRSGARQQGLSEDGRIERYKALMLSGRWDFVGEGRSFVYWQKENMVWISEGHHRANAALEIGRESGDWSYLHRLLEYGKREPDVAPLPNRGLFPTRRWWSSLLLWFGW